MTYSTLAGSVAVAALLLGFLAVPDARDAHAAPNYDLVFPRDRVCRLEIHIAPAAWQAWKASDGLREPRPVAADVTFEGLIFRHATLWIDRAADEGESSNVTPLEFRLSFDSKSAAQGQTLGGFTELTFISEALDRARIRASVIADLLSEAGMAAPATGFMRVYLSAPDGPRYLGLYTVIEGHASQVSAQDYPGALLTIPS